MVKFNKFQIKYSVRIPTDIYYLMTINYFFTQTQIDAFGATVSIQHFNRDDVWITYTKPSVDLSTNFDIVVYTSFSQNDFGDFISESSFVENANITASPATDFRYWSVTVNIYTRIKVLDKVELAKATPAHVSKNVDMQLLYTAYKRNYEVFD